AAWLHQWKQQLDDYFTLMELDDEGQKLIFLTECLAGAPKNHYFRYWALYEPTGKEPARDNTKWTFEEFFKDMKKNFIPVNHINDQMADWAKIRQGGKGQSDEIKDIAIRIRQLAEQIDDGKTIG